MAGPNSDSPIVTDYEYDNGEACERSDKLMVFARSLPPETMPTTEARDSCVPRVIPTLRLSESRTPEVPETE